MYPVVSSYDSAQVKVVNDVIIKAAGWTDVPVESNWTLAQDGVEITLNAARQVSIELSVR